MSQVAILGAGPIGATIVHRLAQRQRTGMVTLIDARVEVAAGKALDIQQSGPVERYDTRVATSASVLSAVGAGVVVLADSVDGGEWRGEEGLAVVATLLRAGLRAPLVFAGADQLELMERCYRELKVPAHRLIGTAPGAVVGAARALSSLELQWSGVELSVVGRPGSFVVCWSGAAVQGSLLTDRIAGHRLLALASSIERLWPPGPHAIAAASVPAIEALLSGSRRLIPAAAIVDGDFGARGRAVLLPLEIGIGRVRRHVLPSMSPQERTALLSAIAS